jgi:glycosyltransferase involved in cell wall biosynthesis
MVIRVVVPTHGRPVLLRRTLESVANCKLPGDYHETIVVENGVQSGAEAVVREMQTVHPHLRMRYMHVESANKSNALNEALLTIVEGLVVFLDDDVRVAREMLVSYADSAARNPAGSFFGGPVSIDYERTPRDWVKGVLPLSATGYELDDRGVMTGEFLGFNWAARVEDLKAVGLFDPNFGPGSPSGARGQESDMQTRLRELGLQDVGVEGARVWHYVPRDRSTFRWAFGRRYRMGISSGIRAAMNNEDLNPVFVRRFLSLGKQIVTMNPRGAASVLCGMAAAVGSIKGFRTLRDP